MILIKHFPGQTSRKHINPRILLRLHPLNGHRSEIRSDNDFRPEISVPSDNQSSDGISEIGDLEEIYRNTADHPRLHENIIENRRSSMLSLPRLRRLELKLFGYAYIGHRRQPGWKGPLPFYAFKCGVHGLVEDYPHGYNKRLDCPLCIREDELIRVFDEREG